jgi:hypothetical protein
VGLARHVLFYHSFLSLYEELGSWAVSALSVRSRKISIVRGGQSLDGWPKIYYLELLRASEGFCWSRLYLQSLASTPVSRRVDVRQAAGRKNKCRIFITTWLKHVVPSPLSGIRVGTRRFSSITHHLYAHSFYSHVIFNTVHAFFLVTVFAQHAQTNLVYYFNLNLLLTFSWNLTTNCMELFETHFTVLTYEFSSNFSKLDTSKTKLSILFKTNNCCSRLVFAVERLCLV